MEKFQPIAEALGVRWLLGAATTMWVLVGASPTGPTSNGQPEVEEFKAGSMEEGLSAPSGSGWFLACYYRTASGTKKNSP
jgi:hypothetical protein